MIVVPVSLTEKQYEKLRKSKEETGVSIASIVRLALEEYFSRKGV